MFYVYIHCRPDGSPFYVGKGCGARARDFRNGRNQHHRRTVKKYGKENILVITLPCKSESDAFSQEIQLIKVFRSIGYKLANKTDGGEGCSGDDDVRAKMSAAKKGKPLSAVHRANLSASRIGNRNAKGLIGTRQSPEHIARRADARRGKKYPKGLKRCN